MSPTILLQLAAKYWYAIVIAALVALAGSLYVDLAHEEKAHAETKEAYAQEKALEFNAAIKEKAQRDENAAKIDQKYAKELSDAKSEIDRLAADVRAGKRGLRIAATCTPATGAVTEAQPAPSVDDGSSPRLTDAAQRDYFTLRAGIETATSQIGGLQEYVLNVCLK